MALPLYFQEEALLQFDGKTLDKKDWFGKSDPILVISKHIEKEK